MKQERRRAAQAIKRRAKHVGSHGTDLRLRELASASNRLPTFQIADNPSAILSMSALACYRQSTIKCKIMFDGHHALADCKYGDGGFHVQTCFSVVIDWLLTIGTLWAASDPFVGNWKLDPSRSKQTDQMKIEAAGTNRYTFDFGGGATETIVVDGTEQPGHAGTILSVTRPRTPYLETRPQEGRAHSNDGDLQALRAVLTPTGCLDRCGGGFQIAGGPKPSIQCRRSMSGSSKAL
jgi:hypothetical protein